MNKSKTTILVMAAMTVVSGCSSLKKSNAGTFDSGDAIPLYPVTTASKADLGLDGRWYVKTVGSVTVSGYEDDEWPYIEFSPSEARFYGNNGCNLLNGSYRTGSARELSFSHVASTMKYCPGDTLAFPISNALENTATFDVANSRNGSTLLTLKNAGGNALMTLRKSGIDFLNGAWQVIGINGKEINVADARLVFDIDAATLTGNAGCNRLNGEIARNPQVSSSVQFSNLATTRMTCPDIETESALLIALETVVSAKPDGNDVLLLDAAGHNVVKLRRLSRADLQN